MNVLLVYKKNAYHRFFRERGAVPPAGFVRSDLKRFRRGFEAHLRTLQQVRRVLRENGVKATSVYRGRAHDYSRYRLVIAVGGDGTFLEAARRVTGQRIIGVNSDPERSTGTFCRATGRTFGRLFARAVRGQVQVRRLQRLRLTLNGKAVPVSVLNDVLVTDRHPGAMSRYWIRIGGSREEQRSSGLWISTAAGSTGAIKSAGGRVLPLESKTLQYRPRELYRYRGSRYRLAGGLLPGGRITVGSLMRDGVLCVDGGHYTVPFRYGDVLRVTASPHPLRLIDAGA